MKTDSMWGERYRRYLYREMWSPKYILMWFT